MKAYRIIVCCLILAFLLPGIASGKGGLGMPRLTQELPGPYQPNLPLPAPQSIPPKDNPLPGAILRGDAPAAPPTNDDFDTPYVVGGLPVSVSLNTVEATIAIDDPAMGCGSGTNSNTVWFRLTVTAPSQISADTLGSDFDTVLGVFTGTRGALS